jgi:hypothetical protein
MAKKLLIIHGYSDGATSFVALRDFFVSSGAYARDQVFLLNYDSLDDESTFEDFADKLDDDFSKLFGDDRIDVACHSTGALVARAWLRLRYRRQVSAGVRPPVSPVEHLLMFAPANFGSDLARLGQSFLGKFRSTFFNSNHQGEDFMESGRVVLQGLEPASPFQWFLSADDLHGEGYFNSELGSDRVCYPFILAAGRGYGGLQGRLIPARRKPGTDGTVRICGTSLNTRKCVVDFAQPVVRPVWCDEKKFRFIPFAIFDEFTHGSIVSAEEGFRKGALSAGRLALAAIQVSTLAEYEALAKRFDQATTANHPSDDFQQFFFKVRDDVGFPIVDYYLDFYVLKTNGKVDEKLTAEFDREFESEYTRHSADPSCRVLLLNVTNLRKYLQKVRAAKGRLVFDITARAANAQIRFLPGYAVVFDGAAGAASGGEPTFLFPNTTTLVEIVLNRVESDRVLHLLNHDLTAEVLPVPEPSTSLSGRAALLS